MQKRGVGHESIELLFGLGLLLGPLAYALTLAPEPAPEPVVLECPAASADQPELAQPPREQPPRAIEPEVVPEPVVINEAPKPKALAEFLFVTDAGVVLSTEAEQSWGAGKLFEPKGLATYRAAKRADPNAIPSQLWSMRGRTFDLYGPEGRVCTARLGELRVIAQYDGWGLGGVLGEEWFDRDPTEATKQQIREGLWQLDDHLWLVAEIESIDDCEGALWARDAELPPAKLLRRSEVPNHATAARLALFESEELVELERSYRAEYAATDEFIRKHYPSWEQLLAEYGSKAWSWVDEHGRPHLVGLEFGRPPEPCDPLFSRVTALDLVHGPDFVAIPFDHSPAAVFDVDFDGQWERLYSHWGSYTLTSATVEAYAYIEEDFMCPC